jgi:hypothetical protein
MAVQVLLRAVKLADGFAWVFASMVALVSLAFASVLGWDILNRWLSEPLVSQLLSTAIGVAISSMFWWLGGRDLRREAEDLKNQNTDLRRLNGLTLRILEIAKLLPDNVEVTKDEAGNPTGGLTYNLAGTARGLGSAEGTLTVTHPDESADPDDQGNAEEYKPEQQG